MFVRILAGRTIRHCRGQGYRPAADSDNEDDDDGDSDDDEDYAYDAR